MFRYIAVLVIGIPLDGSKVGASVIAWRSWDLDSALGTEAGITCRDLFVYLADC